MATFLLLLTHLVVKSKYWTDLYRSCRGLLLEPWCREASRGDAGTGHAHSSTCASRWSRWRWRGGGGHGRGHPGHGGTPVGGLHSTEVRPHSTFLPGFLRLPHLVGRCLPGHQLSVWYLLPPVPYAELTEENKVPYCSTCNAAALGTFHEKHTTTDSMRLVTVIGVLIKVCSEQTGIVCSNIDLAALMTFGDQQATGISNTNYREKWGPVSQRKFILACLSLGHLASLSLTLAILVNWYHKGGYSGFYRSSYRCVHITETEFLITCNIKRQRSGELN